MGFMNAKSISDFELARQVKLKEFNELISSPFDMNNTAHLKALQKHLDAFDFIRNQMYLYQSLTSTLKVWGGVFALSFGISIPSIVTYTTGILLYTGLTGYLLENFSKTDFNNELNQMMQLYNWVLKNKSAKYDGSINNDAKLANPIVQRLVLSLAPLCSDDFMLAWEPTIKKENTPAPASSMFSNVVNIANSSIKTARNISSMFYQKSDQTNGVVLEAFKKSVETRSMDLDTIQGLEVAMKYFTQNEHFRELCKTTVVDAVKSCKDMGEEMIGYVSQTATARK